MSTSIKHWLFTDAGRAHLSEEYVAKRRSTYEIADGLGTYPNLVRRALIAHGIRLRSRSEAQKQALTSGRHGHPTKGRRRSDGERQAISDGVKSSQENE